VQLGKQSKFQRRNTKVTQNAAVERLLTVGTVDKKSECLWESSDGTRWENLRSRIRQPINQCTQRANLWVWQTKSAFVGKTKAFARKHRHTGKIA
jgi:hypothetical protein